MMRLKHRTKHPRWRWLPFQSDLLTIESFPLHTEEVKTALQAPAQAEAAFKRGADFVGFTEVNTKHLDRDLAALALKYGYAWFHSNGDTALAVKSSLTILEADEFVPVAGSRGYTRVKVQFVDSEVTVIYTHWATNVGDHKAIRQAQTVALVEAMASASDAFGLAFYAADSNPDGPLSDPTTEPRASLDAAGFPLVNEALGVWPSHLGVNTIGYAKDDVRVTPVSVETFDALGSDHIPELATFSIRRNHRVRVPWSKKK